MLKFKEQLEIREYNIGCSFINKYLSAYYMSGTLLGTENKRDMAVVPMKLTVESKWQIENCKMKTRKYL